MQKVFDRLYSYFENTPAQLKQLRYLILAGTVLLTAVMALGIFKHFSFDVSNEAWLEEDSPPLKVRNTFRHLFGSEDGVFIVYRPKSGDVFSESALRTLTELHKELEQAALRQDKVGEQLARIVKLDSLYNARYQVADGDTLISRKLIGSDFPATAGEREHRRAIAKSQENFRRLFYSEDFQYGGIQLKTDFGVVPAEKPDSEQFATQDNLLADDDFSLGDGAGDSLSVLSGTKPQDVEFEKLAAEEYMHFMRALRSITEQPKYADFEFYFAGSAVSNEFLLDSSVNLGILYALMALIIMVFLWRLFRSLSAVLWPILIVILSGICAIGTTCWLGFAFTGMLLISIMLVLAVTIASCVHVFSIYSQYMATGKDHDSAIAMTYRKTGVPILLSSVTTAVGMLSLLFADIPGIRVFGFTSAFAIAYMFMFICFLLPVLLSYWHPASSIASRIQERNAKANGLAQALLHRVCEITGRRTKSIVVFYAAVLVVMIFGMSKVKVDNDLGELGWEGTPIQTSIELIAEKMMGGMSMEILLTSDTDNALKDPRVLTQIAALQQHMIQRYPEKIIKTISLADIVKDSNQVMHEGKPEFHKIPDDPDLTAQLLYLFNNANPDDRRSLVTDNYRSTHITILIPNGGTLEYTPLFNDLRQDLDAYFSPLQAIYPDMKVSLTGTFPILIEVTDDILWGQVKSFLMALLVISIILMVALGSLQAGMIAMIPNLLPSVFTLGFMGWMDMPLDADILLITPVIIGIAVDDTIHFLSHYRYVWDQFGDVDLAVDNTLRDVGQAVLFTSLILGLGFSVLGLSEYFGMVKTGLLGSMAIFVALLSDLFFLPAMMRWFKPNMGRQVLNS